MTAGLAGVGTMMLMAPETEPTVTRFAAVPTVGAGPCEIHAGTSRASSTSRFNRAEW